MALERLGWDRSWAEALRTATRGSKDRDLLPGRVVREHRGAWDVETDRGEQTLKVPGSVRHRGNPIDLPAVGDWVICQLPKGRRGAIVKVLPRRSLFVRRAAGLKARPQAVAANVDVALVLLGLDGDFNMRRLERYLAATCDSGAEPVIVLNKRDLLPEWGERMAQVKERTEVLTIATNALAGELGPLPDLLQPGRTFCLLGSSGVGKSTVLNAMLGHEVARTPEVRERDQKGKHTTTHRELFALPGGALIIDTPGMRELQLWEADEGLQTAFEDISRLSADCPFRDCEHRTEPDCAVLNAIAEGQLERERLDSWRTLRGELDQQAWQKELERRRRPR